MSRDPLPLSLVAALAALLLALAYWGHAATSPDSVGLWQDDGIYLSTAQSLAEGRGYRHIEIASQPLQTKYPVLYPALLAGIFRATTPFPANLPWLLLPTALAAAAGVVLAALYWRRVWGESAAVVWTLALLTAASPVLVGFVRFAMSDLLYGALAMGALLCVDVDEEATTRRRWIAAGLLAGLALLTRGLALTLITGIAGWLLLRRRPLAAAGFVCCALLPAIPWWLWQSWAVESNGVLQHSLLEAPELGYALWLPAQLGDVLRVAQQNLFRTALSLGYFQLALPAEFVREALQNSGGAMLALHALCWSLLGIIGLGFAASARRGTRAIHFYAAAYAGVVWVWPFAPDRYGIPWVPFLLYFGFVGLRALAQAARVPRRRIFGALVAVTVAGLFLHEDLRLFRSTAADFRVREVATGIDLRELRAVEAWLRQTTPADSVVASAWPAGLFLHTGRRGHFFWPDADPYGLYYGEDRTARQFYATAAASEHRVFVDQARAQLLDTWLAAGIDYYVDQRSLRREAAWLAPLIEANPRSFAPVYRSPGGTTRVYRVVQAGRAR